MLKQILIVVNMIAIVSVVTTAQESSTKVNKEVQTSVEIINKDISDSTTSKGELVIWNKVCPVKGNPIEEDTPTVEYNGKLYGFCCPGCDTKFAKNPEKYSKNLSEDGTKFIGRK